MIEIYRRGVMTCEVEDNLLGAQGVLEGRMGVIIAKTTSFGVPPRSILDLYNRSSSLRIPGKLINLHYLKHHEQRASRTPSCLSHLYSCLLCKAHFLSSPRAYISYNISNEPNYYRIQTTQFPWSALGSPSSHKQS